MMSLVTASLLGLLLSVLALIRSVRDHYVYERRIRDLQRKTLEAQRILKQRGELANEIAHEIKNPITAILCSAETLDLLIGPSLDEVNQKSLRYIKEYGDNLLRLVSDFLDVSRAESGKIHARPEGLRVLPIVESVIGLLESNAIKKHISIRIVATDPEVMTYVDPKHLKQITFNLVHNAIKFTDHGGEIRAVIESGFPANQVKLSIRDNGAGMSAAQQRVLFDPYARYSEDRPSVDAGVGLGLSLCKILSEIAGGSIEVDSTIGQGTSFEVTLPAYNFNSSTTDAETTIELLPGNTDTGKPLTGQNFLVVDEDNGSRESISRLIEAWGGMVDNVSLAVDAVEALGRKTYDAVMIDDTMDGIYGYELARMIRDETRKEKTTIILATRNPVDPELARESGADKCIEKPLNGKVLLHSLLKTGKYFLTH